MKKSVKHYLTVALAALFVFGFSLWGIAAPDKDVSLSERRPLSTFPKISYDNIYSGKFMTDFEAYSLDQFPLRDTFRGVKANAVYNCFAMKDNNGIFLKDGHIFKTEYPYNKESVIHATEIFKNIYNKLLTDENNVYISVIPDKNYFLGNNSGQLVIDYNTLISDVKENTKFASYIDITSLLSLDDYYRTDSHWRQENIVDVSERLLTSMGAKTVKKDYNIIESDKPFYGVYYGQAAIKVKPDSIFYLTDSSVENATVYDWETSENISVYEPEKLNGQDPYEMFLSGSKSLLTIENKENKSGKELIVFRDSFGSSIAPLLLQGYSKITLVDIRYRPSAFLGNYIEFTNQDVLFLYSTSVLNNSITLK